MNKGESRRRPLSEAFRKAYEQAGLSQPALSQAIGVDQSLISKYARGVVQPPLDLLPKVDEACGQTVGHVLRLAGYVEPIDVSGAIAADPVLTPRYKRELTGYYEFVRTLSADADK